MTPLRRRSSGRKRYLWCVVAASVMAILYMFGAMGSDLAHTKPATHTDLAHIKMVPDSARVNQSAPVTFQSLAARAQTRRRAKQQPKQPSSHPRPPPVGARAPEERREEFVLPLEATRAAKLAPKLSDQKLEQKARDARQIVTTLKRSGVVMSVDPRAIAATTALQQATKQLLLARYSRFARQGGQPGKQQGTVFHIQLDVKCPSTLTCSGRIVVETAPLELMPHAVKVFMDLADSWTKGAFHRNAGHVLQAKVEGHSKLDGLAFQEYSAQYPHVKGTLGYAGRPGGPAFYISTIDNTRNHGPGSQGSATEADSCFARIISGDKVVERLNKAWGRTSDGKPMGFIPDHHQHAAITAVTIVPTAEMSPARAAPVAATPPGITVKCETSRGDLLIDVFPQRAPAGAERFLELVDSGRFSGLPFFRVVAGFLTQFGPHPNRAVRNDFRNIKDDPKVPGRRMQYGTLFFAGSGDNSRRYDMCFAFCGDTGKARCNPNGLGKQPWENPVAQVRRESFPVLRLIEQGGHGDMPPWGKGPRAGSIPQKPHYLDDFPRLDYFHSCTRQ